MGKEKFSLSANSAINGDMMESAKRVSNEQLYRCSLFAESINAYTHTRANRQNFKRFLNETRLRLTKVPRRGTCLGSTRMKSSGSSRFSKSTSIHARGRGGEEKERNLFSAPAS